MKKLHITYILLLLVVLLAGSDMLYSQIIRGVNGSVAQMQKLNAGAKISKKFIRSAQKISRSDQQIVSSGNLYFCLMFNQLLNADQTKLLADKGIVFIGFVGNNTYLLKTTDWSRVEEFRALLQNSGIQFLGISDVPAAFKFRKNLYAYLRAGNDIPVSDIPEGILITVFDVSDLSALKKTLGNWSIAFQEITAEPNALVVNINQADVLNRIAQIQYVSSIQKYTTPKPESTGYNMSYSIKPNQIDILNYGMKGPIGRGVYFANWEVYGKRDDFPWSVWGREVAGKADRTDSSHGCNTTQTACAANNIDEYEGCGMAPGVMVMGMNTNISPSGTAGVSVVIAAGCSPLVCNHSVGWQKGDVGYDDTSRELDMATYNYPTFLQCYSAGNDGNTGELFAGNIFPGYSSMSGAIKTNKNNFTVNSSVNVAENWVYGSFGPTEDGRLKPDICAEGSSGTSFASPALAGLIADLFESYRDTYGKPERGDVVKAVILNTAIDMGRKGIDFVTGFGQINPLRAFNAIKKQNLAKDYTLPQGTSGIVEHQVQIPEGTVDARILLYWHDYPGLVGASKALVNDLDLEVINPNGETIFPWVLDATPANVKNLPVQKRDSLNNVEQVTIENPVAGKYTIRVKGTSVVVGPQKFVLTWDFQSAHIQMTSHPNGFKLSKMKDLFVSWDFAGTSSIAGKSVDIYFRPDNTSSWIKVATTVGKLYYKCPVSDLPACITNLKRTSTAQFKVVCDGMESVSGNCQYAETPANLRFVTFTTAKLKLGWDPIPDFKGRYIIYTLGDKYMQPLDSVISDSTKIVLFSPTGKTWGPDNIFAIAARDTITGAMSLRSLPVCINQFSSAFPGNVYNRSYSICYGDTIRYGTPTTEGDIVWYKNGAVVSTLKNRMLNLSLSDMGSISYRLSWDGSSWLSDPITIAPAIANMNIADTALVGNYVWKGYVFKGGSPATLPMYGKNPCYYGRFDLEKLSFDSNRDIFPENQTQSKISGYNGCTLSDNNNTTVLKRTGFIPAKYNIWLTHVSQRVKVTIVKNGTVLLNYLSDYNPQDTVVVATGLEMDENCQVRIEWYGNRLGLILKREKTECGVAPGNVKTGLSIWVDPSKQAVDNLGRFIGLENRVPQSVLIKPVKTNSVSVNVSGLNYNPTLYSSSSSNGGLIGLLDDIDSSNVVSDFLVCVNNSSYSGSVFSAGKLGTNDSDNMKSYISLAADKTTGLIGTTRNNKFISSVNILNSIWNLVQVQYAPFNVKLKMRGKMLKNVTTSKDSVFNIDQYSVGTGLSSTTSLQGQIAEVIHYNRELTEIEEKKVNSYVALKYGFTLPGQEYVNSSGTVVMPVEPVYRYNVAGVVCDSVQDLVQKQSKSVEGPSDLVVGSLGDIAVSNKANSRSFVSDSTFMIWANNNKYTSINTITMNSYRTWKLQALKNKQPLQLNFIKSIFPTCTTQGYTSCLIISDSEDLNNETIYPLRLYTGGDNVQYLAAEIPVDKSVKYFTIGYRFLTGTKDVADDKTTVSYDNKTATVLIHTKEAIIVELISQTGVVLRKQFVSSDDIDMKVDNLLKGVYLVRIIHKNGAVVNKKLIIE